MANAKATPIGPPANGTTLAPASMIVSTTSRPALLLGGFSTPRNVQAVRACHTASRESGAALLALGCDAGWTLEVRDQRLTDGLCHCGGVRRHEPSEPGYVRGCRRSARAAHPERGPDAEGRGPRARRYRVCGPRPHDGPGPFVTRVL